MTAERTDRELLELAAKACGYKGISEVKGLGIIAVGQPEKANILFNPLENDGDALRLAVTLDIAIEPRSDRSETEACTWVSIPGGMETIRRSIPHGDDPGAATRRAIVLVAAVLWEQIQLTRIAMGEGGE